MIMEARNLEPVVIGGNICNAENIKECCKAF